jgi:NAD(P)-dependent dehydrogenase (short-subunit alcohol dehydrogenase family)/acyl carrier protein
MLLWPDPRTVDLVLSPLAGELRNAGLGTLKDEGLFIDISPPQPGTSQSIPIKYFEAGVRFIKLDFTRMQQCSSETMRRVLAGLERIYTPQSAQAIPQESFAAARVEEAFDACIRDAFVGKLVVHMAGNIVPIARRLALPIAVPDAGYLVTGGFGGMGLATIKWLCSQGARHVAVLSRNGPSSKPAQETLKELRGTGVRILHEKADIAKREDLNAALGKLLPEMPPLRGVIHCAGVLADTAINAVSASLVDRVMGPKAGGALHLHRALDRQELDFVVYYSSIAATLGNYGQLNYAAANGFLHGLVLHRRAKGLPGTCINWGPVAEVGMAARDAGVADSLARLGLAFLPLARVFELLEEALAEDWVSFDVVDINWGAWSRQATDREKLRLSKVLPSGVEDGDDAAGAFHNQVLSLGPNERRALIFALVLEISSEVLRLSQSRVDSSSKLRDLGIDSIMAAEISQMIFDRTGIRLRILYLTRGPSLLDMTKKIEEAILSGVQPG